MAIIRMAQVDTKHGHDRDKHLAMLNGCVSENMIESWAEE